MKTLKSRVKSSLSGYFGQNFWKTIVIFEINILKFAYLQSLAQKQKSLSLRPEMSNMSILGLEFESTIVIFEIIALKFA